jgi:hypothetical protein
MQVVNNRRGELAGEIDKCGRPCKIDCGFARQVADDPICFMFGGRSPVMARKMEALCSCGQVARKWA